MEQDKLKTAKLAMEADGNIIGNCFIMSPDPDLRKKLGVLFGIVEIYNINDTFIDGLWEAINDLKTEYYLPPLNLERGIEKRFEEAIARTNRRIKAAVSQSIEEVDLRNLSAVLGIIYGNKVYLTSVGRIKGLFTRRKKNGDPLIADILNSSQEKRFKPEAEKVFANILSGELEERDAILCLNDEFLGVFSQTELAEIALDNSASEIIKILESSLQEKIAKKNFYAIAIRPETEPEETINEKDQPPLAAVASNQAPLSQEATAINAKIQAAKKAHHPQQSIDRLLYTQVKTEKYLNPSTLPNWQKALLIIWKWTKQASQKGWSLTKKGAAIGWQQATILINQLKNKKSSLAEADNKKIEEPIIETAVSPIDSIIIPELEAIEPEMIDSTPDLEITINEPTDSIINPDITANEPPAEIEKNSGPTHTLLKTSFQANDNLSGKINDFINTKIIDFLKLKKTQQIAVVILSLLLFVFAQSVVMIGRSLETTGGALGYEKIVNQIEDQLNSAEAQNIFNDELGALEAIKKAWEILSEIPDKRTTRSLKSDLTAKIETASRKLQHINYQDNPLLLADFEAADNLIGLAKTDKIFWSFNNQNKNLLRFDTLTDKLEAITSSLPTLKKLTGLDNKNFLALTTGNEVYKYDGIKNTAAKITPSKDYFLIKKYQSQSNLIIPPLASSTIIMSMVNDNYSLFLDSANQRIVILDKEGDLKRQFVSPVLASTTAFAANFSDKKLWAFADNKIYQLEMDF